METHWTEELKPRRWHTRGPKPIRGLTATKTHWIIWGKIEAFEGETKVFRREWNEKVERKLN